MYVPLATLHHSYSLFSPFIQFLSSRQRARVVGKSVLSPTHNNDDDDEKLMMMWNGAVPAGRAPP